MPIKFLFVFIAATPVEPLPIQKSRTVCVTPDEPLTQSYGFLCAVRRTFLLISGKGQNVRGKSLGAVVAFCLVFPIILSHLGVPLMRSR